MGCRRVPHPATNGRRDDSPQLEGVAVSPIADLCPGCGYRQVDDPVSGFCIQYRERRTVEIYQEKQSKVARRRSNMWAERTAPSREWDAERQRAHRLLRDTRPRQPASPFADPLEIASEALDRCTRVRQALKSNIQARAALDEVEEALRRLAWGPQLERSHPAKPSDPSSPVFDVTTPAGRMRRSMHLGWHIRGGRPCNCRPSPST